MVLLSVFAIHNTGFMNHSGRIQYTYVFSSQTTDNSSEHEEKEINKSKRKKKDNI
jgi:hypothetical protein